MFLLGVLLHVIESPHPTPTKPSLLVMKQGLINCRQHEAFIKVLMVSIIRELTQARLIECTMLNLQRDIIFCAEHLDYLEETFKSKMDALKDTVQSKTAVPTAQVYVSIEIAIMYDIVTVRQQVILN